MIRSNEYSLKDALKQMVKAYKLSPKLNEARVIELWPQIMGESVSKRTTQLYIRDNKLFIKLNSSVLRDELMFSRSQIVTLINENTEPDFIKEVVLL